MSNSIGSFEAGVHSIEIPDFSSRDSVSEIIEVLNSWGHSIMVIGGSAFVVEDFVPKTPSNDFIAVRGRNVSNIIMKWKGVSDFSNSQSSVIEGEFAKLALLERNFSPNTPWAWFKASK